MGKSAKKKGSNDSQTSSSQPTIPRTFPNEKAFSSQLQKDPSVVIRCIEGLYANRTKGSGNPVLLQHMKWLEDALHVSDKLSDRAWFALAKGQGIGHLYLLLIQTDGFFEEHPDFMTTVFVGLGNFTNACELSKDSDTERFLLSQSSALFRTVWENREQLRRMSRSKGLRYEVDGHPAMYCMLQFAFLHKTHEKKAAGTETWIPQVAAFGWACLRDLKYSTLGLAFVHEVEDEQDAEALKSFVRDIIFGVVGAEAVFESFEMALEFNSEYGDGVELLSIMLQLVKHPSMLAILVQRDTFEHIVKMLTRRAFCDDVAEDGAYGAWLEWWSALGVFELIMDELKIAHRDKTFAGVKLRGQDTVAFLALGTTWIAQAASHAQLMHYGGVRERCTQIAEQLYVLATYAKSPDWRAAAPDLTNGILAGAHMEWLPTIDTLRAGGYRLGDLSDAYALLSNAWTLFGALLGLDEGEVRRKHCSYLPCPFNKQDPTSALSPCKGCGEVRYCGKQCQRGDWRSHKQVCGKRVK